MIWSDIHGDQTISHCLVFPQRMGEVGSIEVLVLSGISWSRIMILIFGRYRVAVVVKFGNGIQDLGSLSEATTVE